MAPCHTERRSLSCLEREPRRESEHGVRVRSRAHQCLRGPGRGGEQGREWAAVGRARHGEQRPPPHVATWLPRGPSFQSFLQEEAHTPSISAEFLDQNLLAAGSKVAEHNSEGRADPGPCGRVPSKLLHARQGPACGDRIYGRAFCDPLQPELGVLTPLRCGPSSVSLCVHRPSAPTCPIRLLRAATSRRRVDAQRVLSKR